MYKYELYSITYYESCGFRYNVGIYDTDDVSYFQLSWKNKSVREFSYLSYKNCEYIELIFLAKNIEEYKNCLTKPFYEFLKSLKEKNK
ncbi:MAG: hypothetical protein DSY59_05500 [Persephonella sp.]|nr:MAG: hypothetical protein DSY59_05500 [Persephonella sp.]